MGRVVAVLFAVAALSAGCGGSSTAHGLTLDSILKRPGPDIGVTAGAGDFAPGSVRFPFLVIASNAKPVERPSADVWVATSRDGKPFQHVRAKLEPIGVPGRSEAAFGGVRRIYVAHLRIPRAASCLRTASTTSTTGPQVRLVQNFGVANVTTKGTWAASDCATE